MGIRIGHKVEELTFPQTFCAEKKLLSTTQCSKGAPKLSQHPTLGGVPHAPLACG